MVNYLYDFDAMIKTSIMLSMGDYATGLANSATNLTPDRNGYQALVILVQTGGVGLVSGTGSAEFVLRHADENVTGSMVDCDASDFIAPVTSIPVVDSGTNQLLKFTYIGNKRFVRLKIAVVGTVSVLTVGASYILGNPQRIPIP